uniref:Uncharacterized protein n=1 Tax=Rhizophora mucronata TaxID=61149 RepID=A0A2P2N3V3_RHIMU
MIQNSSIQQALSCRKFSSSNEIENESKLFY